MRSRVILAIILFSGGQLSADPYLLFNEKGKIGIKDAAGAIVIPAAFDALGWSDGSFSVVGQVTGYKLKDHWGLINLKKEYLSRADYESLTYPGGDRIIAQRKINPVAVKVGCLNLHGEVLVPFRYDGIKIQGLRAVVFVKNGANYQYGLIDLNGREIIPAIYKNIYPLGTLRYAVENVGGKTSLFSDQGILITHFVIDSISSFRNDLAIIYQGLNRGLIDRDGQIRIVPQLNEIQIGSDGEVMIRKPNEWKILQGNNVEVRRIEADQLLPIGKNLYRVAHGNRFGVVDQEFNPRIPQEFTYIGPLQDGKLVACKNGKFGILRTDGSILLPFQFDSLVLDGKLVRVREDVQRKPTWSIYDTFGIKKTNAPYDFIGPLSRNLFPAKSHGFWGGIDRYGEELIHCVYDSLLGISDEQIAVKFKGLYGIVNTNEDWLLLPQVFPIQLINPHRYLQKSGKTIFLKDFAGHDIYFTDNKIECRKDFILETSVDGTEKQIDYQGTIMPRTPPSFGTQAQPAELAETTFQESEGLRGIRRDGKYGFVDSRNRLRIANRYDGIGLFKGGLAPVKIINKWGFIDTNDNIVIQPSFEWVTEFSLGRALVKRAGKYGVIDAAGSAVLNIRYDSIVHLADGNLLLLSGNLEGLAEKSGQLLIDPLYNRIEDLDNGYAIIQRDGKFGLLTLQGLSTVPLVYDNLLYDKERNQYLVLLRSSWRKLAVR